MNRVHMEEDAGKHLHEGFPWSAEKSASTSTAAACR